MLLRHKYSSIAILLVTWLFSSLSLAQNTVEDKKMELKVTAIRRVMKDGEHDPKNHHTKVVITGLGNITGEVNCSLRLKKDSSEVSYNAIVTDLENEIIFEKPLVDADSVFLIITDSKGDTSYYYGLYTIRDLKARVAFVGDKDNNKNYLRVTTGDYLDEVKVDDAHACKMEDSPCYYQTKTLDIKDKPIPRCIRLYNTKNETLLHCDDTYSDFIENIEPTRLLLNDTLHLIYMLPSVAAEVVMVDPNSGNLISNDPNDHNCTSNEEGCSIELKIEGLQNVNFIVVFKDDDYVDGSMIYPFEIFEVAMTQLTNDAAMTTWSLSVSGTFDVLITTRKDLVEPNYYCNRKCDVSDAKNGGICEAFFFIQYEEGRDYFAIIRPEENNGKNAIGIPISEGSPLNQTTIDKIARTPEADIKTTVTFKSTNNSESVKLVEITINSTEVTNIEYIGQVSETLDNTFQSSKDIGGFDRDMHFILIIYNEIGGVQEVGEALVTWRSSSVQLDWVGEPSSSFSALREVVKSGTTHIDEENECDDKRAYCYFLEFSYESDTLPLCATTTNGATGENIDLCDDMKPNNPPELNVTNLMLIERKNLTVTTEHDILTKVNLVWYVNKDDPSSEAECKFPGMATDNENPACTVDKLSLEGDSSLLTVLLVRTDRSSGNVTESSVLLVDDLEFLGSKLSKDSLMVKWTGINNKYTATLLDVSPFANDRNRVMIEDIASVSSDIVCGEENICYAHFFDLFPKHEYSLSVHKDNDEVTTMEIKSILERVPDEPGIDLGMSKITKIDSTTTEVVLTAALTKGTISVIAYDPTNNTNTDETGVLKASGESDNTFQFTHEIPIFDVPKEVNFILLAQKAETKYKGLVGLNLTDLETNVAWIGAEDGNATGTLRVDTGNQPSIKIGNKNCLEEKSPCYFIEDESVPEIIERCINLTNETVQQCDAEITPYKELKDAVISLEDDQIKVTVAANSSQVRLEVIIYDPEENNKIISTGETDCGQEVKDNEETMTCTQLLNIPKDRTPVRVLVSEINDDGIVLKSSLSEFYFPDDTSTDTWVIVVSVLASVLGASLIVFIIVVAIKKKKSRKAKDSIDKELSVLSEENRDDTPPSTPSAAKRDSFSGDFYSRPLAKESRQYSRKGDSPQTPMKPTHRMSRNDDSPYSRTPDSRPPLRKSEGLPRSHYDDPYSLGHDNKAYSLSPRSEDGPSGLPRIMPKPRPKPNPKPLNYRAPPSSYYY